MAANNDNSFTSTWWANRIKSRSWKYWDWTCWSTRTRINQLAKCQSLCGKSMARQDRLKLQADYSVVYLVNIDVAALNSIFNQQKCRWRHWRPIFTKCWRIRLEKWHNRARDEGKKGVQRYQTSLAWDEIILFLIFSNINRNKNSNLHQIFMVFIIPIEWWSHEF